jgi:CBS domain-containing protein
MAAYTQGKPLGEIPVSSAASRSLVAAREGDTLQTALDAMRHARVRRLPVIDAGGRPVGVLSWSDLVRHVHLGPRGSGGEAERLTSTFAAICERKRADLS